AVGGAASADDSRVRHEREPAAARARRPDPAVFADQAGVQADEVPRVDDLYRQTTGRLLGGPGVSLVRGHLTDRLQRVVHLGRRLKPFGALSRHGPLNQAGQGLGYIGVMAPWIGRRFLEL